MRITNLLSDEALLVELGERLTRTRLNRNTTQAGLADEAGVSKRTVERLEAGASTQLSNLVRILRALDLLGNFELVVPEPTPSPLAQLKLQGRQRVRASSKPEDADDSGTWEWGDDS